MMTIEKLKNQNAENIRKIARTKEIEDRLNEIEDQIEKSEIEAKRSIAYIEQTSSGGSKASGKTKETGTDDIDIETDLNGKENSEDEDAIENQEDGKGADAGSGGGSGGMNAEDDGKIDIEDLLDPEGISEQNKQLGLTVDGNGQLKAISGIVDCDSESDIEVRFNQPIKPPSGWFSADTPLQIEDDSYVDGRVWNFTGLGFSNSFYSALSDLSGAGTFVAIEDNGGSFSTWQITSLTPSPGDYLLLTNATSPQVGQTAGTVGGTGYEFQAYVTGIAVSAGYGQQDCGLDGGDTTACSAPPPGTTDDVWPTNIPGQLAYNNGQLEAAPLDPNIPSNFKNNNQSIYNFCFGDGRFGRLEPTNDGGFMIMETSALGGSPEGVIRYFNSKGELTGFGDTTTYNFRKL